MTNTTTRNDYPRPQFVRGNWLNLNGSWEFRFDDEDAGMRGGWHTGIRFERTIQVPFCYQSELSGIGEKEFHDLVWYRKTFQLPDDYKGKRLLLHFGAVDYAAWVWVNGHLVAAHEGGHTPFTADITTAASDGANEIVVKVRDYSKDVTLPRGKQYWKEQSEMVFYTRTTGIWQTVWLEAVSDSYLERVMMTPDIDRNEIGIRVFTEGWKPGLKLRMLIKFQGERVSEDLFELGGEEEARAIRLHDFNDHGLGRWWTPEKPNLYDVTFHLLDGGVVLDEVESYFGMRKISIEDGKVCLNNRPYYMKLVLDQGYFPGGLLTAGSDDELRRDVELMKMMGFNGARKHQKIEDPRYLYWCDKLGLLVWGEMANAYQFSETYVRRITQEWQEAVKRDYNHPCIVVWLPINESWGVPNMLIDKRQQEHTLAMYYLTKSLDGTRLVLSNDGWEHTKSDLATIHDYEWRREVLKSRYETAQSAVDSIAQNRWIYVPGYSYNGEPLHVSEFGGISFRKGGAPGWGYSAAADEADFLRRILDVVQPLLESKAVQGYCYTQLTDVEQEINGLLTFDRKPKLPLEVIRAINEGKTPSLEAEGASKAGQHQAMEAAR
ncbi:glycoside hydrolase family 2 [Paenibacillus sp. N4]|uniref:glycoside hydrolase family 2 protein n=1 Tax=Paenibacillus vietnamensis TaxID=2590547 RepID=UPI001CD05ACF|nr:sugar-binding domain-containing protein [Paenibacillus vietnamensis]MCA0755977.1 glycoside hydrolase family 2 [Paenibacillus vietnamensis]